MKIGVDIRCLMDENYSGVSEYTANLLSALLAQDQDNEYRLFYNSWRDLSGRLSVWTRPNASVTSRRYPNKLFNYLAQKLLQQPKIDWVLGGVDIFFSPHFNFTSLSRGVKKIITVHDLSFLRYPHFFSSRKNFWHRALGVKKILLAADRIIAVSENTKNDIIELVGVAPEKISVIYSGNNAVKREVGDEEIKIFLDSKNISPSFLLYIGTIEPRKNISGLIQAFDKLKAKEQFKDLQLVLGGARGWKNREINRTWQESAHKTDIIFLGYISQKEKEILYSGAQAFVYPSFYEGFGFPPLEAMTYGLPVVCSHVSSLPEVVGEAAVMVDPFAPSEIADALELVLSDENLRSVLKERGQERAKMFSWDKAAVEYLKIFNSQKDNRENGDHKEK